MAKKLPSGSAPVFEQIKRLDENGMEFWSSRDLAKVFEYLEYRNFQPAIERAKEACKNSGQNPTDHFVDIHEMIPIGKGGKRQVESVRLSRYACYLIVQNADPAKELVALGQTYFAVQTRLREIQQMEEYGQLPSEDEKRLFLRNELRRHNSLLADAARNAGVIDAIDYAIFQNFGYQGLYGGLNARDIHARKGLQKSQQILDHMGSTELAANLFRATQTDEKLRRENIQGKAKANQTHFEVGKKVRQTIEELGGTMPENLPTEDSILKLERQEKKKINPPA
ncbi:MAG: DNA damage-inducible protein D [Saprospiraceae bacterium]